MHVIHFLTTQTLKSRLIYPLLILLSDEVWIWWDGAVLEKQLKTKVAFSLYAVLQISWLDSVACFSFILYMCSFRSSKSRERDKVMK